jgi:hypothetical protein
VVARHRHADPHLAGAGRRGARELRQRPDVRQRRSEWAPGFAIHDLASLDDLAAADPSNFPDDAAHYLWAWIDESTGSLRFRLFAANLGVQRTRRPDLPRCASPTI